MSQKLDQNQIKTLELLKAFNVYVKETIHFELNEEKTIFENPSIFLKDSMEYFLDFISEDEEELNNLLK